MKFGTVEPQKGCKIASTLQENKQNGGRKLGKIRDFGQDFPKWNIEEKRVRRHKRRSFSPECRFSQQFFRGILLTILFKES